MRERRKGPEGQEARGRKHRCAEGFTNAGTIPYEPAFQGCLKVGGLAEDNFLMQGIVLSVHKIKF